MTKHDPQAPPLTADQLALISQSFAYALQKKARFAVRTYERFFELEPETWSLFPDDMTKQRSKITWALSFTLKAMTSEQELDRLAGALARSHARFQIREAQLGHMAESIIGALGDCLGPDFTPEMRAAWGQAFERFLPRFMAAQTRLQAA